MKNDQNHNKFWSFFVIIIRIKAFLEIKYRVLSKHFNWGTHLPFKAWCQKL